MHVRALAMMVLYARGTDDGAIFYKKNKVASRVRVFVRKGKNVVGW